MSIWRCELTDARSVRIRFTLSLLWSLPFVFGGWLLRWRPAMLVILVTAFGYLSVVGLAVDRWRLGNPAASKESERRIRLFAFLPLFIGIPVLVILFT